MAPRALGALLALVAVVAFAVSIATSAWWAGHPVVDGRPITAKDVHVGLLGAEGCNTGGDGSCEPVAVGTTYKIATYAELAIVGLTALLALALAISVWTVGDRRKGLARATIMMALIAAAGGGAVLALGPAIKSSQRVDVPIGWGLYIFGGAIAASLVGGAIGRKVEREPLRLKPSLAPNHPSPQLDVRDMLREQRDGMLHPGSRKSEPRMGQEPMRESVPLFGSAPQLRPLYDPHNQGLVPAPPPPALPRHAPTPLPQRAISALTGIPTPYPVNPSQAADPYAQTPDPFAQTDFQVPRAESEPIEPPPPRSPSTSPPPGPRSSPTTPPRMAPSTEPPRPNPPTNPPPRTSPPTNPPRTSPPTHPPAGSPNQSRAHVAAEHSARGLADPSGANVADDESAAVESVANVADDESAAVARPAKVADDATGGTTHVLDDVTASRSQDHDDAAASRAQDADGRRRRPTAIARVRPVALGQEGHGATAGAHDAAAAHVAADARPCGPADAERRQSATAARPAGRSLDDRRRRSIRWMPTSAIAPTQASRPPRRCRAT